MDCLISAAPHQNQTDACRGCELKPQCTANTYRRVGRWTEEAVLERMEVRLAARPEILKQRREIAEHPFGSIKHWMNQGTFLLRGLEKVRAEFSLTVLAYNVIRVMNIVGVCQPTVKQQAQKTSRRVRTVFEFCSERLL